MSRVGELRPSQLIFSFGVGSLVDLPHLSALVMGLDEWKAGECEEIAEDRLLAAVREQIGRQVQSLRAPPLRDEDNVDALRVPGVPVAAFPRWMRCTRCGTLATVDHGVFQLRVESGRPDRTRYLHVGCSGTQFKGEAQAAPVRFLQACRNGHLSDFPWVAFVHQGGSCGTPRLRFNEFGISGEASDINVECLSCSARRNMGEAFARERNEPCNGLHPHLRRSEPCDEEVRTILLGASNSWFPVAVSALSLPRVGDRLMRAVEDNWNELRKVETQQELAFLRKYGKTSLAALFSDYDDAKLWKGIVDFRQPRESVEPPSDLKLPEWRVFSGIETTPESPNLKLRTVAAPKGFEKFFEPVVLVERLREVRALIGFSRIESNGDFSDALEPSELRLAPLAAKPPEWAPVTEVRGEGLFIRFKEPVLRGWEQRPAVIQRTRQFLDSHRAWRTKRGLAATEGFPGTRYLLLHTLAHALMRQIALHCGYTAASVRERIYCRVDQDPKLSQAGVLIYTAASDSEGTLGGLVRLGEPDELGMQLVHALDAIGLCASDPLCADHAPETNGQGVHGACCHACLFAPETACERGNRFLDRGVLVRTYAQDGWALFDTVD